MTEREKVLEILDRVGYKKNDYHLSEDDSVLSILAFHPYPTPLCELVILFDSEGNIADIY